MFGYSLAENLLKGIETNSYFFRCVFFFLLWLILFWHVWWWWWCLGNIHLTELLYPPFLLAKCTVIKYRWSNWGRLCKWWWWVYLCIWEWVWIWGMVYWRMGIGMSIVVWNRWWISWWWWVVRCNVIWGRNIYWVVVCKSISIGGICIWLWLII
jgi:hypothetical protein